MTIACRAAYIVFGVYFAYFAALVLSTQDKGENVKKRGGKFPYCSELVLETPKNTLTKREGLKRGRDDSWKGARTD